MNLEQITLQDCIDMYVMEEKTVVINNGKIEGFISEKKNIPADR